MRKEHEAYWVKDGSMATLYVSGKVRAEAHIVFNSATIYTPRRFFRKDSTLVVSLDRSIVSDIEKTLGFAPLPAFDRSGNELTNFRNELEGRARSFENWENRPSHDPVAETVKCLDEAHNTLNIAAREGRLDASAADARLLCAKASIALEKDRRFSQETADTIEAASKVLTAAVMSRPVMQHPKLTTAAILCGRAAALAKQYGPDAGRATPTHTAAVAADVRPVEAYVASDKVTITKGNPATDFWLHGHLTRWPDYTFDAKVFDVGSEYGIEGGRISKLKVTHKGTEIMNYDRGWEQTPRSWKDKAVLKEVLAGFPQMGEGDDGLSAKTQKGIKSGRGF
jgi:hypothetical protein